MVDVGVIIKKVYLKGGCQKKLPVWMRLAGA